jgi:hypothetical protein
VKRSGFNAQTFLESSGIARTVVESGRGAAIFTQGDACEHVMYPDGGVKLSVVSKTGKEGRRRHAGPRRLLWRGVSGRTAGPHGNRLAITPTTVLLVAKADGRLLHKQHAMSDRFIAHMLARNIRIERT